MSIISCTSPSPSALILPISSETRLPRSDLCRRSSSPTSRTASPRFGAGTARQASATSCAAAMTCSYCAGVVARTLAMISPVAGFVESTRRAAGSDNQPPRDDHVPGLTATSPRFFSTCCITCSRSRAAGRFVPRPPCARKDPCCRRWHSGGRTGCRARRRGGNLPGARSLGNAPGGSARGPRPP